jgi:hypothetical protein
MYRTANHTKEFFMKNLYKLLGIAVLAMAIVFSFAACDNSTSSGGNSTPSGPTIAATSGEITITGLTQTSHVGKFAYGSGNSLAAAASISSTEVKLGTIAADGSVTLKVWKVVGSTGYENFTEDYNGTFTIIIADAESFSQSSSTQPSAIGIATDTITFTGGKATVKAGTYVPALTYPLTDN